MFLFWACEVCTLAAIITKTLCVQAGPDHQPARVPLAHDHRHADREPGGQGGRAAGAAACPVRLGSNMRGCVRGKCIVSWEHVLFDAYRTPFCNGPYASGTRVACV